ncbi:MAG TPA: hypothetical protein VD963_09760, partial [Phycisphaerales bacterium]|nr:hypothetical protein [Phycisphaerales bacterium]
MDGAFVQPWMDYSRNYLYVSTRAGSAGTATGLWVIRTVTQGGNAPGTRVASFTSVGHGSTVPPSTSFGTDTPPVEADTLYLGQADLSGNHQGKIHAINPDNLTQLKWAGGMSLQSTIAGTPKGAIWEGWSGAVTPTVGFRRLYVVTDDGTVDSFRAFEDTATSGVEV